MSKLHFLSVKDGTPPTGYWDHTFINDLFAQIDLSKSDREVFVIPAAYQNDYYHQINVEINKFPKVMVILTSDEEHHFNETRLQHTDMILYSQYGNGGIPFPLGYTPHTRSNLVKLNKDIPWFFSGQNTHYRRQMLSERLKLRDDGILSLTDGFAKGMNPKDYIEMMCRSKFVFCPPGPVSVESFRLYEALECGCIPIADTISPIKSSNNFYWNKMFGDYPQFLTYSSFDAAINALSYSVSNIYTFSWWIGWKYRFKEKIKSQLGITTGDTAVIITTSIIPSHPSLDIIDETIASVRAHLPDSPIIVLADGVRDEQVSGDKRYEEYLFNLSWKCNTEYSDVIPVIFGKHSHQSGMLKHFLGVTNEEKYPYLLMMEHDTPLTPDREIPFEYLKSKIADGTSNMIRFHFEAFIPDEHRYLMNGGPTSSLLMTAQWSQRPHLVSTKYYKHILETYFSESSNTFIEDRMYGILLEDTKAGNWDKHRVHIFHPEGDIKRSYHTDGRAGERKFDDRLIY